MELTKKDRVLLINQYKILAALYKDDVDHYEELIAILENGYEIFYSMLDEWVSDNVPDEEGKFVLNILDLYRAIDDVKRSSKDANLSEHSFAIFRGFDGNNETSYMGFARFLIEKQGKYSEQKDYLRKNDNMNSHMPMIAKYRKMLDKWQEFGNVYNLTLEQANQILDA